MSFTSRNEIFSLSKNHSASAARSRGLLAEMTPIPRG
jgi:hypothetical protein